MSLILLGGDDIHTTTEASGQAQTVSGITQKTFERKQVTSNSDENESNSSPAARDQIHENVCAVWEDQDQNNASARDGSQHQDHNYEKNYGEGAQSKGANE